MDEGSQVDRKEYSQYKERFDSIFDTPEFKPLVMNYYRTLPFSLHLLNN